MIELRRWGLSAENQVPLKVIYKNVTVGEYFADILVEGKVIVEIKAVTHLLKEHQAQLLKSQSSRNTGRFASKLHQKYGRN